MTVDCEISPNNPQIKEKVVIDLDSKILREAKKHKINIEEVAEEHLKAMRGIYP